MVRKGRQPTLSRLKTDCIAGVELVVRGWRMREDDFTYFNRRADEELVAAKNSRNPRAARIHIDLANRMRQRAGVTPEPKSADAA